MSEHQTELFLDWLVDRLDEVIDKIPPAAIDDFNRYIAENDLQGAEAFLDTLEAKYASDL